MRKKPKTKTQPNPRTGPTRSPPFPAQPTLDPGPAPPPLETQPKSLAQLNPTRAQLPSAPRVRPRAASPTPPISPLHQPANASPHPARPPRRSLRRRRHSPTRPLASAAHPLWPLPHRPSADAEAGRCNRGKPWRGAAVGSARKRSGRERGG